MAIRFKAYVWLLALAPAAVVVGAALTGVLDGTLRASVVLSGLAITFGVLAVLGLLTRPWRVANLWQRIAAIGGTALVVVAAMTVGTVAFSTIQEDLFATTAQGARNVAVFDGGLIAVGTDDAGQVAVWVSRDAESWDRADHSEALAGIDVSDVAEFGDQALVVGQAADSGEGVVLTSRDGRSWIRSAIVASNLGPDSDIEMTRLLEDLADVGAWKPRAIAATDSSVAVVGDTYGNAGVFWQSTDGLTWTVSKPLPVFDRGDELVDVVAWKDGFVAVGFDGTGSPQVWTMEAGTTWTLQSAQLEGRNLRVAATDDAVVVIGATDGGSVASWTTDGVSWTLVDAAVFLGHRVDAVAGSRAGFAAVGVATATGETVLWTSSDGTAWGALRGGFESADVEIHDVVPFGDLLIAVGYDKVNHTAAFVIVDDRFTWRRIAVDEAIATLE